MDKIESLRYLPKYKEVSEWIYEKLKDSVYTDAKSFKDKLEEHLKKEEIPYKQKDLTEMLDKKTWTAQKDLMNKAIQLKDKMGQKPFHDFNIFLEQLDKTIKEMKLSLDAKEKKQILDVITWKNIEAEKVLSQVHEKKSNLKEEFGYFLVGEKCITYKVDTELRDYENVPLDQDILNYFQREVKPHVPEAWIDSTKKDPLDEKIGLVGYEIPFNRHFYEYKLLRPR